MLTNSLPTLSYSTLIEWHIASNLLVTLCLVLLLFADDAVMVVNSAKHCQELCHRADKCLNWSKIEVKVVKCRSLEYHKRPSNECYDPQLCLANQTIPYLGDSQFSFLGLPLDSSLSISEAQDQLLERLQRLCQAVDELPLKKHIRKGNCLTFPTVLGCNG